MADFIIYNSAGENIGTLVAPSLFETAVDEKLIHRYFIWVRTMLRHTVAHTKTRGNVRGGGKKPWKQKGTGRARTGSIRNPIWRKGGTIFGPLKSQTYETRMPRQERRKAFFGTLAAKANEGSIMLLEEWNLSSPKTKDALTVLSNLKLTDKKVLYIHANGEDVVTRSVSNIQKVTATTVQELNVIQVLHNDTIIMSPSVLTELEQHFTPAV